jgi:hypothetical protein
LCAKDAVVIPPRAIVFIVVGSSEDFSGEVYVEGVFRQRPGHEYSIPGCITTVGGMISIRNLAEAILEISTGQLMARGVSCSQEDTTTEVSNFSIQTSELLPFQFTDVCNLLGPELEEGQQKETLGLINEFRDCYHGHQQSVT